jgi:hypothetical protein
LALAAAEPFQRRTDSVDSGADWLRDGLHQINVFRVT